jgi:hypothetical protein
LARSFTPVRSGRFTWARTSASLASPAGNQPIMRQLALPARFPVHRASSMQAITAQ